MCAFDERVKEFLKTKNKDIAANTFVERMGAMEEDLRKWVALDLHDITKASIWTILYSWSKGRTQPLAMQTEAIAEYFGVPSEVLFPKNMKC